ncbi:D-serine deaminase, pyridoxal phosphate-dependent [Nonomuraea maritima]|uniref:D-serine deaminase, pyridoxal phosphate-dependent n=1 Tax=Nonomuraea maritima TaxID=683260 RepID=A0A1G8YVS7_9ACTN|nr:alanine racemase [Nonomuraea maritima]SDK06959.1 D-serine deaminase, pyridoxal phosphate-dependent [Nonomuraea maritima]
MPAILGQSIFDGGIAFPVMVAHRDALEHNVATMAAFARDHGLEFAPHAKTHLSPEIAAMQLAAGAWGLTVATLRQAETVRGFGARRVLVANQVVDPAGLAWAAAELERDPDFEFLCFADSVAGLDILARHAGARPFRVLAELGHAGGRAGCRTLEELLEVVAHAQATPGVELAGVAGYEGGLKDAAQVRTYLFALQDAVEHVRVRTPVLSVGGSQWFDVIGRELAGSRARVLLRSGAYVSHDDGFYRERTPFNRIDGELRPALEVWAHVLSTPEPGLAIVGMGKRDAPYDEGLPIPRRDGVTVLKMQDQHTVVRAEGLRPGDLLAFGISHPCTAFDKWRVLPLVDQDYRVVGTIHTYF